MGHLSNIIWQGDFKIIELGIGESKTASSLEIFGRLLLACNFTIKVGLDCDMVLTTMTLFKLITVD